MAALAEATEALALALPAACAKYAARRWIPIASLPAPKPVWERMTMAEVAYGGLMVIGDPHLEGRQPGFRKDDYPTVILDKVAWCLDYAARHRLLPALLGDVFDKPRDNPNWLVVRLLELLRGEVLALFGNHDVHYNAELTDDDSLSLLVKSDRVRLVSEENPWRGTMSGRAVVIGGSSYRQKIPEQFDRAGPDMFAEPPLTIWLAHHDVIVPGYDEGRFQPREIEGIDLVINGHIHRRLEDVQVGRTLWLTPGISAVASVMRPAACPRV